MADFNKPTDSDSSDLVLELQNQKMLAIAKMDYSQYTNVPTGVIQFIDGAFKKKTTSGWEDLPIEYTTSVLQASTATITGNISANSATIVGDLSASNATLSGDFAASTGVINSLGATDANIINELNAVTGNFSGSITSPTITTINSAISAETTRATNAESSLSTSISGVDARVTQTQGTITTEINTVRSEFAAADVVSVNTSNSYTDQKVAELLNSAPSTLDTLKELATALGNDPSFATTVSTQIGSLQSQLNTLVPSGVISQYAGTTAPSGWLLCDGSAISRTTYASLFSIIGTVYGAGNGSTTFNLPNFKQKFPLGKADSGTGSTLGSTGGSIDLQHQHTGPSHYHTVASHGHGAGSLRAAVGFPLNDAASGVRFALDGNNNFTPGFRWTASGVGVAADNSSAPSTVIFNSTDAASPDTNYAGTDLTGTNAAINPPFITINYIIKD